MATDAVALLPSPPVAPPVVPPELCCCITYHLLRDPVVTAIGHTYERAAIETAWRGQEATALRECAASCSDATARSPPLCPSPLTNEVVPSDVLVPNWIVRKQARRFFPPTLSLAAHASSFCRSNLFSTHTRRRTSPTGGQTARFRPRECACAPLAFLFLPFPHASPLCVHQVARHSPPRHRGLLGASARRARGRDVPLRVPPHLSVGWPRLRPSAERVPGGAGGRSAAVLCVLRRLWLGIEACLTSWVGHCSAAARAAAAAGRGRAGAAAPGAVRVCGVLRGGGLCRVFLDLLRTPAQGVGGRWQAPVRCVSVHHLCVPPHPTLTSSSGANLLSDVCGFCLVLTRRSSQGPSPRSSSPRCGRTAPTSCCGASSSPSS